MLSGASAGLVHGIVNFVIVEPYLDEAIGIENQGLFDSGREQDTLQFQTEYDGYRAWQKSSQVLAGIVLGTSVGALFGIVYALSRNSLPGNHDVKKALVLAGAMWFVLYLIPFIKYPANPPTVGDADTIVLRGMLYLSFIAISGIGALVFYKISKKFGTKKFVAAAAYAVFISAVFFLMPENPDKVLAPMQLVNEFRLASILGVTSFWVSVGVILGFFWHYLKISKVNYQM